MIQFLYKYMPLRPSFFNEPMLRATPVTALNDPFEGLFNKNQVINASRHQTNFFKESGIEDVNEFEENETEELMSVIQSDFFSLGIISFTEDHINPLMWAHYADEHRGMVIQFKTEVPLFSDSFKDVEGIGKTRFGKAYLGDVFEFPERVVYRRETPSFEHKEDAEPESINEYHWNKFNKSILFTKANDWIYEKECRSIVRLQDADRIICKDQKEIREICLKHSEIELIELADGFIQITYPKGYEMYEEMGDESIKNEIYFLSNDMNNPPVHLFRIDPNCIRGVYFGCKAKYSSCLDNIRDNENLKHLNVNKMELAAETYALLASKLKM
ncbi:DUF2971 domain-containing protein [Methylovulum miyakonense]|uniref:DUF2971 domain-containing protein n=1 Tax=Methylovulum miyakonense TaxID=645578 RepID=UPI000371027D|nr:DUF2971 domain-containing protein [Methylovulum miyakonense]